MKHWLALAALVCFCSNAQALSVRGSQASIAASTVTITGTGSKCFSVDDPTLVVDCNLERVGIGTASPGTKLHMSSGTLTIDGNASPSLVVNTGDVRIGTAAATTVVNGAKVAIFDSTNATLDGGAKIQLGLYSSYSDTTVNSGGFLGFGGITSLSGTQNPTHWGLIGGVRESATPSNTAGALVFATPSNGALSTEKMRIASTGKVAVLGSFTTGSVTPEAGTQLYYCVGGTFAGNVGRGAGMICTAGTATAMGIWVP